MWAEVAWPAHIEKLLRKSQVNPRAYWPGIFLGIPRDGLLTVKPLQRAGGIEALPFFWGQSRSLLDYTPSYRHEAFNERNYIIGFNLTKFF